MLDNRFRLNFNPWYGQSRAVQSNILPSCYVDDSDGIFSMKNNFLYRAYEEVGFCLQICYKKLKENGIIYCNLINIV